MKPFASILNKVIFLCLFAVIAVAVIPYGTVDPWWEAVFESFVFALTAVWMIGAVLAGDCAVPRLSVLLPLAVLTAYIFIQALQWPPRWLNPSATQHMLSVDHYQTYLTARKCLALSLFLVLLLVHVSNGKRLQWLVRFIIGIGLASALFGILRQFLQPADSPYGFFLPFLFYRTGYGQFISPNVFAYLMEMTLGLIAGLMLGGGTGRNGWLVCLAMMAVIWTALVLSNSRGAIVGLVCQSVFVLFVALTWYSERLSERGSRTRLMTFVGSSRLARIAAILLIIGTLAAGVLWMGGESLSTKLAQTNDQTSDGTTRHEIWSASWRLFKNNPWTGAGFGAYFLAIPQFEKSSGHVKLEQAHNDYLDLAASGGVVGIVLAAWFIGAVVWCASTRLSSRDRYRRAAALGAATGMLGVAVHSAVDFGLQVTGIAVVFTALLGILIADVRRSKIVGPERRKLQSSRGAMKRLPE